MMIDDQKRIPLAVSFTRARTEWKALDESVKADLDVLAKVRRGDFSVNNTTTDMSKWVVAYTVDDGPVSYYLYDRPSKKAEFLFVNNSKLEKLKLAQMEPISFAAKDGLTIHGYLTKPVGVEPKKESASRTRWMTAVVKGSLSRKMVPMLWDTGNDLSRREPYAPSPELAQVLQATRQPTE